MMVDDEGKPVAFKDLNANMQQVILGNKAMLDNLTRKLAAIPGGQEFLDTHREKKAKLGS